MGVRRVGARDWVCKKVDDKNEGIQFKVNGTKMKRGSWIMITYHEGSGLYDITSYRMIKCDIRYDTEIEGTYCDQLMEGLRTRL